MDCLTIAILCNFPGVGKSALARGFRLQESLLVIAIVLVLVLVKVMVIIIVVVIGNSNW